jgi:phage shock protein PspC (stress-responsive transcriptional regulator)
MARRDVPLTRNTDDKKIAGVCSGLAEYFDLDTTLVRVVFVALLVFGGWSLVAYLLLWWLVDPKASAQTMPQSAPTTFAAPQTVDEAGAA